MLHGVDSMSQQYSKTDSGRDEIKSRSRKLSRAARNLLLVIDPTRGVADWLSLVHGATEADLRQLLAEGLIEPKAVPEAARAVTGLPLEQALARFSHGQLYGLLTSQARDRLGLIRGLKLVLDTEKCANVDELRTLTKQFLEMVEAQQGKTHARQMRLAMGAAA
jgi:hypothetical protein